MGKLPVLLSIPHGGLTIPQELMDRTSLTKKEIFNDSDGFTREIYDFRDQAAAFHDTAIARAFVDLNRAKNDMAPANPDGVIKSETVAGAPVYKPGMFPNGELRKLLLRKHYDPYHRKVAASLSKKKISVAFDCHSMLEFAPKSAERPGERRPLICLSNRGDAQGENIAGNSGVTCPPRMLRAFAVMLANTFNISINSVSLNRPFNGGQIIRSYGFDRIPWIQVELNRSLYLTSNWFNENNLTCDEKKLCEIRESIWSAIVELLNFIE